MAWSPTVGAARASDLPALRHASASQIQKGESDGGKSWRPVPTASKKAAPQQTAHKQAKESQNSGAARVIRWPRVFGGQLPCRTKVIETVSIGRNVRPRSCRRAIASFPAQSRECPSSGSSSTRPGRAHTSITGNAALGLVLSTVSAMRAHQGNVRGSATSLGRSCGLPRRS